MPRLDIAKARQAGFNDQQIQQYAQQKGIQLYDSSPQQQTQQIQQPQSGGLSSWLPLLGSIAGGVGGGALGGLVGGPPGALTGGVAGAAALGGAGEAFRQRLTDESNIGRIGKEAALGGGGQLLGLGIGRAVGPILGKVLGGGTSRIADDLAWKSIRGSPSQFGKLKEIIGYHPGQFIREEGLLGKQTPEAVKAMIKPIQEQFTNIAEKEGVTVAPMDVFNKLYSEYEQIAGTTGKLASTKAKALEDSILSFVTKYGDKQTIPIKSLNKEAINVGALVNDFDTAGIERSADRILRDTYRSTIQEAANNAGLTGAKGETLKQLGQRLNKLYEFEGVVGKQEGLGKGSQLAGITTLLGAGVGGVPGGLGGAAAGITATKLANNPKVIAFLAKQTGKIGEKGLPGGELIASSLGQAGIRSMGREETPTIQPTEATPLTAKSSISEDLGNIGAGPTHLTEVDQLKQVVGMALLQRALQTGKTADIKGAFDLLTPQQAKPATAQQQKDANNAKSGLRALSAVRAQIKKDPSVLIKARIPGSPGARVLATASREMQDVLTRLRTGAALNDQEIAYYNKQIPQIFDSPETIEYKLSIFENLFNAISQPRPAGVEGIPLPANYGELGQ